MTTFIKKLYDYHVIQADETPVLVNHDGRSAGSKSYMWVYRSGHLYTDKQIVLYDYHKTRNSSHPREFLSNYSGICVTDGYQVYHTIEKECEDLQIAGCWVHARRKFDEALTVIPKPIETNRIAFLGNQNRSRQFIAKKVNLMSYLRKKDLRSDNWL